MKVSKTFHCNKKLQYREFLNCKLHLDNNNTIIDICIIHSYIQSVFDFLYNEND